MSDSYSLSNWSEHVSESDRNSESVSDKNTESESDKNSDSDTVSASNKMLRVQYLSVMIFSITT